MEKRKGKRKMILNWSALALIIVGSVLLLLIFPDKKDDVVRVSMDFLIEMILILPAVMILLGLFAVWVPRDMVVKFLGRASGVKGVVLSIILGALPTGPLYIAFPIAAALLRKGARVSNIIIFLLCMGMHKNTAGTCGTAIFRRTIHGSETDFNHHFRYNYGIDHREDNETG